MSKHKPSGKPSCKFCCIAPGCDITNLSKAKITEKLVLHNIPKDEFLRKTWLSNLGIPEFEIRSTSAVCSRHFSKESFEHDLELLAELGLKETFRRRLKKNACPNILSVALPTSEECVSLLQGVSVSSSFSTSEACSSTVISVPTSEACDSVSSLLSTSEAFDQQNKYDSILMPAKRARLDYVQTKTKRRCIVPGCHVSNLSIGESTESLLIHNMPKDEAVSKTWLLNLGIPNFKVQTTSVVCSRHFSNDSYKQDEEFLSRIGYKENIRRKLKKNACPNILSVTLPSSEAFPSTSSSLPSSEACVNESSSSSTSEAFDHNPKHDSISMPIPAKRAPLEYVHEFSKFNMPTSIGIQCFIPPPTSTKKIQYVASSKPKAIQTEVFSKSIKVQSDPPPKTRTFGTQFSSSFYCSKTVKTQTRSVRITELKDSGTQTVDKGTQMDYTTKYLTEDFISSRCEDDIFDYEEDEPIEASGNSYQPSQHLEEEVIDSRQFKTDMNVTKENKFIVFEAALLQLFVFCTQCLSKNSKVIKTIKGSMITITTTCCNNHKHLWSSQTELCYKPAMNILTSAAILLSGLNPSKVLRIFNITGIQMFDIRTYHQIQKAYLFRAIKNNWEAEQNALLESLKGQALKLEGDGRNDTPGHCAKYGSYCFLESSIKKIIHLVLIQSNEVKNSVAMELEGLKRGLTFLIAKGMEIACLVTDRRIQIRAYLRKNYPKINHLFDCWHVVKSVKSKISKACGKKPNMQNLLKWSRSIQNHLYWLASSSGGDKMLMQAKWVSVLRHINNKHTGHGDPFDECLHSDLTTECKRKWIDEQSPAFHKLKPIVTKLTEDVGQLSSGCQTSSVEAYHAVVIQFAPKNTHYTFHGMEARLILAALHYNENSQKLQAVPKNGTSKFKKGDYSVCPIMEASTYNYANKCMQLVVEYASNETYEEGFKNSVLCLGEAPVSLAKSYIHLSNEEAHKTYEKSMRFSINE